MSLTRQEQDALRELCRIYRVHEQDVAQDPGHALMMLSSMYGNLSIKNDHERRRHRDSILRETHDKWGMGRFFAKVQSGIALGMVQPSWFGGNRSNRDLIKEFKGLVKVIFVLEMVGISSLGAGTYRSGAKGLEELIKTSSVKKGIDAAKRRLLYGAGSGIIEAAATRMGMALGPWALAVGVILFITYKAMLSRCEEIRAEMQLRVNLGRASQTEVDQLQNTNFIRIVEEALAPYWV